MKNIQNGETMFFAQDFARNIDENIVSLGQMRRIFTMCRAKTLVRNIVSPFWIFFTMSSYKSLIDACSARVCALETEHWIVPHGRTSSL